MSDSLRPPTTGRPSTANSRTRPVTSNAQRPDTAVSSISSLGPAPHTFRPDLDDFDDDEDDGEPAESESETEDNVFAFHRPQTGAVPGFGSTLSPLSEGGTFSAPPTTAATRYGGPPPSTAQFSVAPPSLAYSQTDFQAQPNSGRRASYSPYSASSTNEGQDGATTSEEGASLEVHALPPVQFVHPKPDGSLDPSSFAGSSKGGRDTEDGRGRSEYLESESSSLASLSALGSDSVGPQAVRMRSFQPLVESGGQRRRRSVKYAETEPGSDEGTGIETWVSHSLAGPTTIPHGAMEQHYEDEYEKGDIIADLEEEDSPYPEVRATVSNLDDPDMPALTFRVWLIGGGLSGVLACINAFLYYRNPAPQVPSTLGLLIAYPLGKILAYLLPVTVYTVPDWVPFIKGYEWSLNPSPFNIKEHGLITMMVSVSNVAAYALMAAIASSNYYAVDFPVGFEVLLILSTQLTGMTFAGLTRRFLIWPASLIWPQVLSLCSILNTLHAGDEGVDSTGLSSMTRLRFFWIVLGGSFCYQFLPGWIFVALSYFSWICWMAPNNVIINQLFGSVSGLGMGILTFDWSQINYIGSPLITPWWAAANIGVAFVLGYWVLVPALYYTNTFSAANLPISSSGTFDRFGNPYNYTRIIGSDYRLNQTNYLNYSPLYLTSAFTVSYMLGMALAVAGPVHTILFYGPRILRGLRGRKVEDDDVHARLMRAYKDVPEWWYAIAFVGFLAFAIAAVQAYPTDLPVWALLIALVIPAVYVIPAGYVFALSGQPTAMSNTICQILAGLLFPGQGIPNMIFKAYSVETLYIAGVYSSALKLGHYLKVPPRESFWAMMIAASTTSIAQVGIKEWLFATTPDICTAANSNSLTCPQMRSFFTASVLWGIIGPARQFGPGSVYHNCLYAFIAGGILPIALWLYLRRWPNSWTKDINIPVALNGPLNIPAVPALNTAVWVIVSFLTQYVWRRRHFRLWSKFNYILSVGLDTGTVIGVLIIFLCLQLPKAGTLSLSWWGNLVYTQTLDAQGVTLRTPPETGFGPSTWQV